MLFDADRATLLERLTSRWTNPRNGRTYNTASNPPKVAGIDDEDGGPLMQREDDKAETVAKRLDVYEERRKPLIEYYRAHGRARVESTRLLAGRGGCERSLLHAIKLEHARLAHDRAQVGARDRDDAPQRQDHRQACSPI